MTFGVFGRTSKALGFLEHVLVLFRELNAPYSHERRRFGSDGFTLSRLKARTCLTVASGRREIPKPSITTVSGH
jgi:hypothetical protein